MEYVHTHLINYKYIPQGFNKGIQKFINVLYDSTLIPNWLSKSIIKIFERFTSNQNIHHGQTESQGDILERLIKKNGDLDDTRYIIHSMDLDFTEAGIPENNYKTQLWELVKLKMRYPHKIFPFISIDPRRDSGENLKKLAQDYIEMKGFAGITIYPFLGFFPFDLNLKEVYHYANQKEIPIQVYFETGDILYKGPLKNEHLNPKIFGEKPAFKPALEGKPPAEFISNFIDPKHLQTGISTYDRLKFAVERIEDGDKVSDTAFPSNIIIWDSSHDEETIKNWLKKDIFQRFSLLTDIRKAMEKVQRFDPEEYKNSEISIESGFKQNFTNILKMVIKKELN